LVEPARPDAEADARQRARELGRVRAAPEGRVEAGLIEDPVLIAAVPELAEPHRRARLAAEVGPLLDVRDAVDADRGEAGWRCVRAGGDEHGGEGHDALEHPVE